MSVIFRSPTENDKPILMDWILSDQEHHEKGMQPEFFFSPDSLAMVIGDPYGPGLFVRLDPEPPASVRLHIQFSKDYVKSGKTLLRAWPIFKERVIAAGVKRMVFESRSPRLIGFCSRCFGFSKSAVEDDYELFLD